MKYILVILFFLATELTAQNLIPFQFNELWGFKDTSGIEAIPPQYEYVWKFYGGYAIIGKDGRMGAIDKDNNLVIPNEYEFLRYIENNRFLFGYRTKYLGEFDTGIIDIQGKVIIEPKYYFILPINKTYEVTMQSYEIVGSEHGMDTRKIFNKYGLFSYDGNMILAPEYDHIKFLNDTLFKAEKNDTTALFHISGKQLTEFKYKGISGFHDGLSGVRVGNKCGYLNATGKESIPCKYDGCSIFLDGLAIVKLNGKPKMINTKDSIVYEFDYKGLNRPYKNQFAVFDGKWGMIDSSGQVVLPCSFEKRQAEYQGITFFANDDKWQVYDYDNQKILDPVYEEIVILEREELTVFSFGIKEEKKYNQSLALVRQGDKWGIINEEGKILGELKYELREASKELNKFLISDKMDLNK